MYGRFADPQLRGQFTELPVHQNPRGSRYLIIKELRLKDHILLWLWGPKSLIIRYVDPLGMYSLQRKDGKMPNSGSPPFLVWPLFAPMKYSMCHLKSGVSMVSVLELVTTVWSIYFSFGYLEP